VERMFAAPATYMWPFFESRPGAWNGGFLDAASFDVASDAFATLKDLFTRHKSSGAVKGFLETNYERLFGEPEDQVSSSSSAPPAAAAGTNQLPPSQTPPTLEPPPTACPPTAMNVAPERSTAAVASEPAGGAVGTDATGSSPSSVSSSSSSSSGGSSGVGVASVADVRACRLVGLYGGLLGSERNFFTRRQSLKLLAELLLDRTNFAVSSDDLRCLVPFLSLFSFLHASAG